MSAIPKSSQILLVGQKIRQIRKSRRLTQASLANQIGVTQSDLSRMENGEYKVGLDTLFRILQIFELSMGSFFEEAVDVLPESGAAEGETEQSPEDRLLADWSELSESAREEVRQFVAFKKMQQESRQPVWKPDTAEAARTPMEPDDHRDSRDSRDSRDLRDSKDFKAPEYHGGDE